MEITRLKYFRAMVESEGMKQAAKVLHITPGALSKALRQLESESDCTLFHKVGRRLVLTEDGARLYRLSGPLVEHYDNVRAALQTTTNRDTPSLTFASFEVFTTYFLGALTHALHNLQLHVMDVGVAHIASSLAAQDAEVGLTYIPWPNPDIVTEEIGEIEFGIYSTQGAFAEFAVSELPFAVPRLPLRAPYDDAEAIDCWPGQQVPRRIHYWLTSMESALELVRCGRCVCFLPTFIANLHNDKISPEYQLVRLPGPDQLPQVTRRVFLVRPKQQPPSDELAQFRTAARHILATRR